MRSLLVIDSNPDIRRLVARLLSAAGHSVREAGDLGDAPALLRAAPADVLVTDVALCPGDSDRRIIALRREFPAIAIIPMSGGPGCGGYLRLAAALDGPRTVAQPFLSRELIALLNEVVAGVGAHRAHARYQASRPVAK